MNGLVMWNTLISSYAKLGSSVEASKLFHRMRLVNMEPNVVSWNSLIHGFLNNGEVDEAWESLSQMERHGIPPNHLTWTTLISGLVNNGFYAEGIQTFVRMQDSGIKPNVVSIVVALLACRGSDSLRYGRTIHGYILRFGMTLMKFPEIATSIFDMFAKDERAEEARNYFHTVTKKDVAIYNAMISCNAVHGRAHEALKLYKSLCQDGFQPDCATFTSILSACSHSGFVDEAMATFNKLTSEYRVQPSIEQYGCVVGLLCWCGHLEEALRIVLGIPYSPDAHILGSLVTACRERREIKLAEALSEQMIGLDPGNSRNFVALLNVYAAVERWDRVSKMRNTMREKGLWKFPGCSWVHIGDASHVFIAGDKSHDEISGVHQMLALLDVEIRSTGSANG